MKKLLLVGILALLVVSCTRMHRTSDSYMGNRMMNGEHMMTNGYHMNENMMIEN